MNIVPRGMSIMELYRLYRTNKLVVNRKYQRKLVWTKTEKQALIDSVLSHYPIPLILLAEIRDENNESSFEIIDGMQRLNALFSFIENEFTVKEMFFDISKHPFANSLAQENVFTPYMGDNIKFLDDKSCASFLEYQMPVSTFQGSEKDINEVFGRINSNGKHLSPQEVRQAGVTTVFSEIVRVLSSELRGDVSRDVLPLSDMPEISIDSKSIGLGYGISAEETFWCKQGILSTSKLRDSEDEQFIADLILSIVLDSPFPASKENFDECYGKGNNGDKKQEVELAIATYGKENIKRDIKLVFDKIQSIINQQSVERNYLKSILNPNAGSNPVKEPFYTVFMAFFHLMIRESKEPLDVEEIFRSLTDLSSRIRSASHHVVSSNRKGNIDLTIGLIQNYFKNATDPIRHSGTLAIDFENYLRRSKVEAAQYDFKQGFYTLNSNRKFDENNFEKILHNICALANLGKGKRGYLFIGVTDREEHTLRIEQLDSITAPRIGDFGVVGLEREAIIRGVTLDKYIAIITDKISKSELPEWIKASITTNLYPINYRNSTVLMIEVICGHEPCWYKEDELYVREGANCKKILGGAQINAVYARF